MNKLKPQFLNLFPHPALGHLEGLCLQALDWARKSKKLSTVEWEEQCVTRHQCPVKKGER